MILFAVIGMIVISSNVLSAQDSSKTNTDSASIESTNASTDEPVAAPAEDNTAKTDEENTSEDNLTNILKQKFIEGGPLFMTPILICLIIGLALCIERIITLNLATANTNKMFDQIEDALKNKDVESAKEICRSTRGPVASIIYQGLDRASEGVEIVEKSIVSYGSVQMGLLEKGLVWISLFIAVAPMLGFMGTVIGMIDAFDKIQIAGDINPSLVAGGIKIALLTTVFGLIVAVILQVFYNYIVSKIDSLTNNMEDASITIVDMLVKFNVLKG